MTLAGRDDEDDKGHDFPEVLMDQIKRLREQLDEEERKIRSTRSKGKLGKAEIAHEAQTSTEWQGEPAGSRPNSQDTILTTDGFTQQPMGFFFDDMAVPSEKGFISPNERRSANSICFRELMKVGLDGKMVSVNAEDVPDIIKAQMMAQEGGRE